MHIISRLIYVMNLSVTYVLYYLSPFLYYINFMVFSRKVFCAFRFHEISSHHWTKLRSGLCPVDDKL